MAGEHEQPETTTKPPHEHEKSSTPANRLIDSTSPYLLQHAHNPVDWYPWGPEALERARREEKPIFLSIGYAACHWCHVMEREVFEKPAIAALMNEHFVNIKVDREERPDLDELYMLATQLMTGSGGWPMSVWLTPSLEPFYAGTYFPPEDGYGRPGFVRLEQALADAWKNRRPDLQEQSRRVVEAIGLHADESSKKKPAAHSAQDIHAISQEWIQLAMEQMADRFDETHGGLGGAPKFPPHQALQLWLAILQVEQSPADGNARPMLERTLDGMMNGGIYDHVGGAFARYSTDERWLVPHFEKMLYDSAQLAPVYAAASVLLGNHGYARVARETLDFFLREMIFNGGGGEAFFSSLDADSQGSEGKYYVWTVADVRAALVSGNEANTLDADLVIAHFGLAQEGNWHESPVDGGSVLAIAKSVDDLARDHGIPAAEVRRRIDASLLRMRAHRQQRIRPGLDDKILTSWNGLMISALAISGRVLREPKYLEAAHRLIGFLLTHHMEGGRRLMRVSRSGGAAHTDGFLDDHAFLLNGLMDLIDSTTPTSLPGTMARKRALELADALIRDFEDTGHGGFFYTGPHHEKLFARMKNAADNATPSANGVAIRALLRLARVSGKEQYREVALRAIAAFHENIARRPEYFPTILLALLEDQQSALQRTGGGTFTLGLMGPLPGAASQEAPGTSSGLLKLTVNHVPAVKPGAQFDIVFHVTIAHGHHIQPAQPADPEAFKTVARLRSTTPGEVPFISQEWTYPSPTSNDGATGYFNSVEFRAHCRFDPAARPGPHPLRITLLAQPCSATACFPPERISTEITLDVQD